MKSKAKVCLITGAAGFLGRAVAAKFGQAGYRLYGLDINPSLQPELWSGYFRGRVEDADLSRLMPDDPPSTICHLAGAASVPASMEDPYADFMALMPGTARLLSWNGMAGPLARVLFFSSAAVYGNPEILPVREGCRSQPLSPYGIHKAVGELLIDAYARLYKFDAVSLRIFSAYGPYLRKQVVWDVASKALQAHRNGLGQIKLHGTGQESRDFVYAEDIASVALALASASLPQSSFAVNIGSGQETTIRALAEQVIQSLGLSLEIAFTEQSRPGDPNRWCADTSLLQSFECLPTTSLTKGLEYFADWLMKEAPH